jgi:hypothetical protein
MKIVFLNPKHHKNKDAFQRMCQSCNIELEFTNDLKRCKINNYDILISNEYFFNPSIIPQQIKIIFGPQCFILPKGLIIGNNNDEWSKLFVYNNL